MRVRKLPLTWHCRWFYRVLAAVIGASCVHGYTNPLVSWVRTRVRDKGCYI